MRSLKSNKELESGCKRYHNGVNTIALYKDGYCVQTGSCYIGTDTTGSGSFHIPFKDTDYHLSFGLHAPYYEFNNAAAGSSCIYNRSVTGFSIVDDWWGGNHYWLAIGYIDMENQKSKTLDFLLIN